MTSAWLAGLAAWWARRSVRVQDRLVGFLVALPTGMVLAVARGLTPSADGVGTHMQLGLGGCTVLTTTGWPCPMCGMTTTFSHLAHLQPLEAVATQPFGVVLFVATLWIFAVGAADALVPRGRWRRLLDVLVRNEVQVAVGTLAGLGLGWMYKVAMMGL